MGQDWQQPELEIPKTVHRTTLEQDKAKLALLSKQALPLSSGGRGVQFKLRTFLKDRLPINLHRPESPHIYDLVDTEDPELYSVFVQAEKVFDGIRDRPIWIVKYSGGKDSSLVLGLAVEYLIRHPELNIRIVVIRNDTLMDAPQLTAFADMVCEHAKALCEAHGVQFDLIITKPEMDDRFWVMTLGHGYPPFNRGFRPCTDRIKIKVSEAVMRRILHELGATGDKMAVLMGVRTAESKERAERYAEDAADGEPSTLLVDAVDRSEGVTTLITVELLEPDQESATDPDTGKAKRKAKKSRTDACIRGEGECGQFTADGNAFSQDMVQSGIKDVYPILSARTCKVWDALAFILAPLGWPTADLADIYGEEQTRFGCWMCSLVARVRDLENLAQTFGNEWLDGLLTFRADYLLDALMDENRLHFTHEEGRLIKKGKNKGKTRKGGVMKTGLQMHFRQKWLDRLIALDVETYAAAGVRLIEPEEVKYIRLLWKREKATGKRGKAGQGKGS